MCALFTVWIENRMQLKVNIWISNSTLKSRLVVGRKLERTPVPSGRYTVRVYKKHIGKSRLFIWLYLKTVTFGVSSYFPHLAPRTASAAPLGFRVNKTQSAWWNVLQRRSVWKCVSTAGCSVTRALRFGGRCVCGWGGVGGWSIYPRFGVNMYV